MSSPAVQFRTRVPRLAEAAVERARLTVVPRRRVRAARMPFVALVSMVLLGGVIGLLLFNTSMQQASFAATSLESQASTLSAREQTLRMELDVLRDPQHVAEQARRMGMVTAGSPAFLSLSDGKILGEAVPTDPTQDVRIFPPAPKKPAVLTPAPTYVDAPAEGGRGGDGASSSDEGDGQGRNAHDSNKGNRDHTSNSAQD
jgi:cell division protein FtsB